MAKASDKAKALEVLAGLGGSGVQRTEDGPVASALGGLFAHGVGRSTLRDLEPDPDQPRREFDPDKLEQLAQSIREHGVLQPLVIRKVGSKTYIVAGERRWRAAALAGLEVVPTIQKSDLGPDAILELQLIENLDRENLSDFEQAQASVRLIALRLGIEVRQVKPLLGKLIWNASERAHERALAEGAIRSLGISLESFYKNKLPLLEIASDLVQAINSGQLPASSALILNRVGDPGQRRALIKRVVAEKLPRPQVAKLVRDLSPRPAASRPKSIRDRVTEIASWVDRVDARTRKELERLLFEIDRLKPKR